MSESSAPARERLLEAEALLQFLIKSQAANDENADVVVPALAKSIKAKIQEAMSTLPQ